MAYKYAVNIWLRKAGMNANVDHNGVGMDESYLQKHNFFNEVFPGVFINQFDHFLFGHD
jgi:hypothetical protein